MARYLVSHGHQAEGIFAIDTRDGTKHLRVPSSGDITVNMGQLTDENDEITISANGSIWNGYNISIGNPHAVAFVETLDAIGDLKLNHVEPEHVQLHLQQRLNLNHRYRPSGLFIHPAVAWK